MFDHATLTRMAAAVDVPVIAAVACTSSDVYSNSTRSRSVSNPKTSAATTVSSR